MITSAHRVGRSRSDPGWLALQQLNEAIRFADLKAGAVLAGSGLLAGALWTARPGSCVDSVGPWSPALLSLAAIGAAVSALLALHTLVPRRETVDSPALHYFAYVARRYSRNSQGFIDAWLLTTADDEATAHMLAGHVWAANVVAYRKFTLVAWSVRFLVLGVAGWAAAALL